MSTSAHNEQRLLLIEKVLLLKSISIFQETPETVLAEVAELLEEEDFESDVNIFMAGDEAQCLYIIFKGEVRIHKGDHTFAVFKEGECFGEYALLDTETRSASATTNTECLLLKMNQEPFYELMESRIEVARGIIKELCRRLTAQNKKAVKQSEEK